MASYSLSKKHAIEYVNTIADFRETKFLNVRLYHLYGPEDKDEKFVVKILKALLSNKPEIELTEGNQTRDFIYIDDAVRAVFKILVNIKKLPAGRVVNFDVGTGADLSIREIVLLMHKLSRSKSKLLFGNLLTNDEEIKNSRADIRALKRLGWSPITSLEEGLVRVIEDLTDRMSNE